MLALGLTGGIGAGKSSVDGLLTERGAVVIDADLVAREVVVPGGAAYGPLVERFGVGVLHADGTLDRPALAAVVFNDPAALADLNAITHPPILALIGERLAALAGTDSVGVVSNALLTEAHRQRYSLDGIVVVDCPTEVAVERLVAQRGMAEADAKARVAAQISREERLALADLVIDNSGSYEELVRQMDGLWAWIEERRRARRDF
jgi:dephospho-CoA kinase